MSTPPPPPPPGSMPPPPPGFGGSQPGFGGSQPGVGSNPGYGAPPPAYAAPPGYQPYQMGGPQHREYASWGARLGAYLLDALISGLFQIPAIIAIFVGPRETELCTVNDELRICEVPKGGTWAIFIALSLLGLAAFLYLYSKKVSAGQSWGQKAVNIAIVEQSTGAPISQGKAIGRFFARFLSAIPCYLGFLWPLWDKEKQSFHDKIVGTVVVKV